MLRSLVGLVWVAAGASALWAADSADWITRLGGKAERDPSGNIVAVNLRGSWINDVEMIDLARLPHLQRLDLSHTRITDDGLLHLKTAPMIRDLNLYYAELITDQGMTAIKTWSHLKRLNLRGTRISNGTLEVVSRFTALESLDIANTQVTDNGLDYLITLTNLKELSIGRSRLTDSALEVLRLLPTLTYLDLSGARAAPPDQTSGRNREPAMPENMLRALAELKELRVLKLGYSNITANGLKILSSLGNVEKLGLEACAEIDDRAAAELEAWKGLRYVDLQDTHVTRRAVEALRQTRPGLVVLTNAPAAAKSS